MTTTGRREGETVSEITKLTVYDCDGLVVSPWPEPGTYALVPLVEGEMNEVKSIVVKKTGEPRFYLRDVQVFNLRDAAERLRQTEGRGMSHANDCARLAESLRNLADNVTGITAQQRTDMRNAAERLRQTEGRGVSHANDCARVRVGVPRCTCGAGGAR